MDYTKFLKTPIELRTRKNLVLVILCLLCLAIVASGDAVQDVLSHKYSSSVFADKNPEFWNPKISWVNKYKDYPTDQRAKFPGAKTIFVAFTDGWHFAKWFVLNFGQLAVLLSVMIFVKLKWWQTLLFGGSIKAVSWMFFYLFYYQILV